MKEAIKWILVEILIFVGFIDLLLPDAAISIHKQIYDFGYQNR